MRNLTSSAGTPDLSIMHCLPGRARPIKNLVAIRSAVPRCFLRSSIKKKEHEWLKLSHSQTLQTAGDDLIHAYKRFFKRQGGYPRFKSKRTSRQSFRYSQGVKVDGSRVYLPKIGWVSFRKSRDINGEIKTATVSRSASGWFVSFSCIVDIEQLLPSDKEIGIDVGLTHFATLSTGEKIANPTYYRVLSI